MGILRADRITGLGGANAITGSTFFAGTANTGNYLRIDTGGTEDFTFGTGDFTIEFWINSQGSGFQQHPYDGRGTTNTNRLLIYMDVNNTVFYYGNGGARIQASSALPIDEWVHFALVRASGSTKMYFNGTQTGSTYSDTIDFLAPAQGHLFIGSNGGTDGIEPTAGGYLNGFLSNYRIVKGTAVYTANFTPPTTRLTAIDGTVLLTCTSSGNVSKTEGGNDVQPSAEDSNSTPPVASRFTPNSPVGFSTTTDVGSQYGSTFDGFGSFATSTYMVPPGGNTRERNRGRAAVGGGYDGSSVRAEIEYFNIQSMGTVIDFGNLTTTTFGQKTNAASSTRGIIALGGRTPTYVNTIEFITIATTSNATDFGDISSTLSSVAASSNQTRGVTFGGRNSTNVMEFITIATTGNASDFGDLTLAKRQGASVSSPTRGIYAGGFDDTNRINNIEFITIASAGNASDFGDLTVIRQEPAGASDNTRGVFAGGYDTTPSATRYNTIDYITIASAGNAIDSGDLPSARDSATGTSNNTRGVFAGFNDGGNTNLMAFVTIQTTGNASDFGDLITKRSGVSNCSDSHGGLS